MVGFRSLLAVEESRKMEVRRTMNCLRQNLDYRMQMAGNCIPKLMRGDLL